MGLHGQPGQPPYCRCLCRNEVHPAQRVYFIASTKYVVYSDLKLLIFLSSIVYANDSSRGLRLRELLDKSRRGREKVDDCNC